jgi:hypothetical protein
MLNALDVGDGACTVLRFRPDARSVVIDCGSDSLGPDVACDRLLVALGGRASDIDTIIVTHLDADHYLGFVRLAERMNESGERFESLRVIVPAVPSAEYGARLFALVTTLTGFRSLDLVTALRRVTNGPVSVKALARGAVFTAADHRFTVHWPPARLTAGVALQVGGAVAQFDDLADELEARGDSRLAENLGHARNSAWLALDADEHGSPDERLLDSVRHDHWAAEPGGDEFEQHEQDAESRVRGGVSKIDVPVDLDDLFHKAWNAFRRANNNMSLVLEDVEHRHLVVFGDAERPVLRAIGRAGGLAEFYSVMLAPHHGTHAMPREISVQATHCIAQNGDKRRHLWKRHCDTHQNTRPCLETSTGGLLIGDRPTWCSRR